MHSVLMLVPGCTAAGGIQVTGQIAWQAIQRTPPLNDSAFLFCYGDPRSSDASSVHTTTRQAAVIAALRLRREFHLVLVWHMDLLRLLPFFRLRAAKTILILQGVEAWRRRAWPERALLRRVDQFISISDYTWSRFIGANPELAHVPHRTIPLGVGEPWKRPSPHTGSVPAALMIGRLQRGEDYKGHRQMLTAWPLVLERIPTAQLWIAGDGDLRPELEHIASELGIGSSVRFLGFVSEAKKHELLCLSHCLALPSRGEGFGLVYLEAMRLGRPCLVSGLDAGREVVDPPRHGLAVNPDDAPGVADAICQMLTPGARWREWSERARQRYEQHFTASHYQQRMLSMLADVLPGDD